MPERLRAIIDKIIQWWKKFTVKQKTLIGSIAALVVVALVILAVVVTRPTNITLRVCENATEASAVVDLLEGENIWYETSSDGLTISVHQKDEAKAHILLGSNSISSDGYSLDDVFNGSFATTEADKSKKYQKYQEDHRENVSCTHNEPSPGSDLRDEASVLCIFDIIPDIDLCAAFFNVSCRELIYGTASFLTWNYRFVFSER